MAKNRKVEMELKMNSWCGFLFYFSDIYMAMINEELTLFDFNSAEDDNGGSNFIWT